MSIYGTLVVPLAALRGYVDALFPESGRTADDAELTHALREAESWADHFCRRRLGPSHIQWGSMAACDDAGNIRVFYGVDRPVISLQALKYRYGASEYVAVEHPQLHIHGDYLLFPHAVAPQHRRPGNSNIFVASVDYVSGWCTTALTDPARERDEALTVEDTRFLVPGRKYQLRVVFGEDQTVTVDPAWTPPAPSDSPVPGTVPITEGLWYPHAAGSALTDLPVPVQQGVINYALALRRAYAMAQMADGEDLYPDTALNTGTRYVDPCEAAPMLVADAERLLRPYRDR